MSDKAMLPYIHTRRSLSPTLYVEDPYWRHLRKKREHWDDYYRLHPHHAYWYDYHLRHHYPKDYYTHLSLPRLSLPRYEDYVDPREEAHYRFHRDRNSVCTYCNPIRKKLVPSMHYDEVWSYGRPRTRYMYY